MPLEYHIERGLEEVVAGFDPSSISEGVDNTTMPPVISSVVNTTGSVGLSKSCRRW